MKAYYQLTEQGYSVGSNPRDGFTEYDTENVPVELQALFDAEEATKLAQEAKQTKLEALASLTVTTANGNEFDADDTARSDMMAAVTAASVLGLTEHNWKLSNNTFKVIQLAELKEALSLAIQAKGEILGA